MIKSILILLTGSVFAQIFPLLVSPVLTRTFNEVQFGGFASIFAAATIISVVATFRLEFAFLRLKSQRLRQYFLDYILYTTLIASLLISLAYVILFKLPMYNLFYISGTALFLANTQIMINFWNINESFTKISKLRVFQGFTVSILAVVFGFLGIEDGLIIPYLVCCLVLFIFTIKMEKSHSNELKVRTLLSFIKRSKNYMIWSTLSDGINATYNIGLFAIFAFYFEAGEIGLYFLSIRILRSPIVLFTQSLSNIYIGSMRNIKIHSKTHLKIFFRIQILAAAFTASYLFLIYLMDGMWFYIFGSNWENVGDYILVLWIYLIANSAYNPISQAANWLNQQKVLFLFNSLNLILTFLSLELYSGDLLGFLRIYSFVIGGSFLILNVYIVSKIWIKVQ
jgi:O-antigen/teichoic acid export membrane protein